MAEFLLAETENLQSTGSRSLLEHLIRQFWMPAFRSDLLPDNDGPAVAVRIFGERLVAFRDTSGRVGLMDEFCPHRRTSLAYGRVENDSITCIYHGWRISSSGQVLDCPGERSPEQFAKRIKHKAYKTREEEGVVWAYMGDLAEIPDFTTAKLKSLSA